MSRTCSRFLLILALAVSPLSTTAAEVAVLATLHQVHADTPAYGLDQLREAIISLQPDILCMEVDPADLRERPEERVKVEYPHVVYPLVDEKEFATCALEPPAEKAAEIIAPYVAANRAFAESRPGVAAEFEAYNEAMYELLKAYWTSPAAVNDPVTDGMLGAKHEMQMALIGAGEVAGWETWNTYFLEQILAAARANPEKRIVVLVGVEHGYWLRRELAGRDSIHLLDTAALLQDLSLDSRRSQNVRRHD